MAKARKSKKDELYLVTGASGHLGANLVRRLLDEGHKVRVLLHPEHNNEGVEGLDVERVFGDLRNESETREAVRGCSHVFHVAAKVSTIDGGDEHRREVFETNVLGTRYILNAAKEFGVQRTVVTGSFSAVGYDIDDPSRPADETKPFYPFHHSMPYERSKVGVEQEVLKFAVEGLDVCIATSCAILGGHDYFPSRMGRTLCDFANKKLRAYIPGGFEFVATRDIVEGHVLAMKKGRAGQKYIIATQFLTVDQLMDIFEEVTGVKRPTLRLPARVMEGFAVVASEVLTRFAPKFPQRLTPGAIRILTMRRHADTSKARDELGFEPITVTEAVREAYAFHYARGAVTNAKANRPNVEDLQKAAESRRPAA